ncbi:MAG TPA: glutamate carboxypeptidase [Burkholderiales bacterium]|nr:glutamate carboxypeptidase [Burkholderiales bacterium]
MPKIAGIILALAALCVHAADERLLQEAAGAQPGVIQTLKDLVAIESGSANVSGLVKMADYVEARLKAAGAQTERLKVTRGPGGMIVKATFAGTGKARILLMGHLDTVYPEGILASQPIRQDGNRLYGPGIADDKGGLAVILHTVELLKVTGWHDYARLTVVMNPDEEIGSIGSGELIARLAAEHDYVLSCEPTAAKAVAKQEGLLLGAAGTATVTMDVLGRSAHAGVVPELGRNALYELSYQILQTRDVAKSVSGSQLNWTFSNAGLVRNQIPEKAQATADVRTFERDAAERLLAALKSKVGEGKLVPDTTTTVTMVVGRPPFAGDERSRALAQKAKAIYAELDNRPLTLTPMTGGATDAGYASRSGKAVVLESFGLAGFGYHARDEYVEIDSIVPRLYLMQRLLREITRP